MRAHPVDSMALMVEVLNKPSGTPCKHLRRDGSRIWKTRRETRTTPSYSPTPMPNSTTKRSGFHRASGRKRWRDRVLIGRADLPPNQPAIDRDDRTGHIIGQVGSKELNHFGTILDSSEPTKGNQ